MKCNEVCRERLRNSMQKFIKSYLLYCVHCTHIACNCNCVSKYRIIDGKYFCIFYIKQQQHRQLSPTPSPSPSLTTSYQLSITVSNHNCIITGAAAALKTDVAFAV